jgi:hypothetical protein
MKFLATLIVIVLLSFSSSRRIRSHRSSHSRSHSLHRLHSKDFTSSLYQFGLGLISEISGKSESIDRCLPDEWKTAAKAIESSSSMETEMANKDTSSVWSTIASAIGAAVDVLCLGKDIIKSIIDFFTKTAKKRMRLFYQRHGRKMRRFSTRGWFDSIWDSISSVVTTAATAVKNGVVAAAEVVVDAATKVSDFAGMAVDFISDAIKGIINSIVDKVVSLFNGIKEKINKFFDSPLIRQIKTFFQCLATGVAALNTISSVLTSFVAKVGLILIFPTGFIQVVIAFICGWEHVKAGFKYLTDGMNESDSNKKWALYGRFVARLVLVISKA